MQEERSTSGRPYGLIKWDTDDEVSPMFYVRHHHRHSPNWIFWATVSVLQERSISARPCGWTKWDIDDEVPPDLLCPPSSQTLTTLHLQGNDIGAAGAQHLGEALRVNQVRHWRWSFSDVLCPPSSQTLTTLDLQYNSIGDAGAQYLGEGLRVNQVRHWRWSFSDVLCRRSSQTLTTLDLSDNSFGAEGAQHLREAWQVNQVSCCERETPSIFFLIDDHRRPRLSGFSTVSGVGHRMEEYKVGFGQCAVTAPVLQLAFGFFCCPLYLKVWISRLLNKTCFSLYVG